MAENKTENKVEKAIEQNKLNKYGMTKKSLYSIVSIMACFVLIVVLSIAQATYNPEKLKTVGFWIGVIILSAICIFGLITGQQMGDDTARNNPKGAFRMSLIKFKTAFDSVDILKIFAYFEDWIELYRLKKVKNKMRATLNDAGVYQDEVLELDLSELSNLKTPWKKEWIEEGRAPTYFKSCTDEQIDVIRECLSGHIKVSRLPKSFFMSALDKGEQDIWESAAHASQKKNAWMSSTYIYRILALVITNVIWAGLESAMYGNDDPNAVGNMLISLASRIFCLAVAICWGIYIGYELVKMDIMFIDFKSIILKQYREEYEIGDYKPMTLQERAKAEYEEYQKKQPKIEVVEDVAKTHEIYGTKTVLLGNSDD